MLQLIRQSQFIEGRWRNGMGVSWEIAAEREEGNEDFSWRLAKARIDGDVPFSIYAGMDRVFMQLEGKGLDLEFEGGRVLPVHESFVPHSFSCDVPLKCRLLDGQCTDLNLFTARDRFQSEAKVVRISGREAIQSSAITLFFGLVGPCKISDGETSVEMAAGEAAIARHHQDLEISGENALVFLAKLSRV